MLESVLSEIKVLPDPNVLVGFETADDGGVYRLDDETALVQTMDFFTPVVDDPYVYGQIAAANSLSDIYAMGGRAKFALSIVCFPKEGVDTRILGEIVRGGTEKLAEANVPVIGGHSVQDPEIKFGYCVTGTVPIDRVLTNKGARPEDRLILTKPLGSGIITSGIKFQKASSRAELEAVETMSRLNDESARIAERHRVHAATDITGFGLLGHAYEMAKGAQRSLVIFGSEVPLMADVEELARKGMLPGGIDSNRRYIGDNIEWNRTGELLQSILLDPQTSGGLLLSVHPDDSDALKAELTAAGELAAEVGKVQEKGKALVEIR